MSKKEIEDKFFFGKDANIDGIENSNALDQKEYYEILQLGKQLSNKNFSQKSNKEKVFYNTLKNINKYEGGDNMKKSNKNKHFIIKVASIALVCILGISSMKTAFAQELVDKIVKTITLGHITIFQDEPNLEKTFIVPEEFKGKIFDKDGNPVEVFLSGEFKQIYTSEGDEIANIDLETGEILTVNQEELLEEEILIVKDVDKLNDYTCFEVILPRYLPEGYEFDKAEFFKDEAGVVADSKYIELYFTNGKSKEYIYIQQRFADGETAYAAGGEKVEEIKINGIDAVMYNDRNIDWEDNGVLYMLTGRKITKNELIKIAESFK